MPRRILRKKDWAELETDKLLTDLEDRIEDEYMRAAEEVGKKYEKYISAFYDKDLAKQKDVASGKLSQEEYEKWRTGQILIGKRWKEMQDTLAEDYVKADLKARSMIDEYMPEAYALNHNYGTFEVEKGSLVDTSYTLYNRQTVERLIRDNPTLLPKRKLDIPKDKVWNKKHINSAITQGVLQGDDLRSISKRLQKVTDMDKKAAIRNARTMMTGAQNAGRLDAYQRAENMGIEVYKEWMATLDHHTRTSHARLDGERVKLDDAFSNGCMFPGDIDGKDGKSPDASEVYNCRCTMVADVPEYPDTDLKRYDNINGKPIDKVTYREWAGWKEDEARNNAPAKKEYDFEGKKALFESFKQAEKDLQSAEFDYKHSDSRETYVKRLKERYSEVSDLTDAEAGEMREKVKEIEKQLKEIKPAYDKWYDRPSDPEEKAEWRKWRADWLEKYGEPAPDYYLNRQNEMYKYIEKISDYDSFSRRLNEANRYKTQKELSEAFELAKEKYEKVKSTFDSRFTEMDKVLLDAYTQNIQYKKTDGLLAKLNGNDIIRKLAGGDKTTGSCQSLALCYAGNRAGIDVTDFRGGQSQKFFANYRIPDMLLKSGMKGKSADGYNEQALALKLLKGMEDDKEYILSGGRHAAVVRRIKSLNNEYQYEYQYLEMQSSRVNGWKLLGYEDDEKGVGIEYGGTPEMLKWRFSMQKSRSWQGVKIKSDVYLLDVDSAKDVENFDTLLGFMNTDLDKQMKGSGGDIK